MYIATISAAVAGGDMDTGVKTRLKASTRIFVSSVSGYDNSRVNDVAEVDSALYLNSLLQYCNPYYHYLLPLIIYINKYVFQNIARLSPPTPCLPAGGLSYPSNG